MNGKDPQGAEAASLSRNFNILLCLLVLLGMSVYWLISDFYMQGVMGRQANESGQALARQAAVEVAAVMAAGDEAGRGEALQRVAERIAAGARVVEVTVMRTGAAGREGTGAGAAGDAETRAGTAGDAAAGTGTGIGIVEGTAVGGAGDSPIAFASSEPEPPETLLPLRPSVSRAVYRSPVWVGGVSVGYVQVILDLSYIEVHLLNNLLLVLVAGLLLMVLGVSLSRLYFQSMVGFPLQSLRHALGRVRQGDIEKCPEPNEDNELALTIRQFNITADFLNRNTVFNLLRRVGGRGAEGKAHAPLPGESAVTLMCVTLANHQYLASSLSAGELAQFLNKYYFLLGKTVQLYGGRVVYCTEGRALADFSRNTAEEDQAFLGVCAGQLFLGLTEGISSVGGRRLNASFRLAVHSGQAISGLYSPVTGSNDILTGQTVDAAWRICEQCPDNRLLVSRECYEQAGGESRLEADGFGNEGGSEDGGPQTATYLLREPMPDYKQLLERQAEQLLKIYDEGV